MIRLDKPLECNYLKKNIFIEFIKYTSANIFSMVGISCYILADTYFIARELGADGLTSLNLAIPIFSFIYGIGLMLGIGGATRYSILKSQIKNNDANRVYTNTIMIGGCFSFAFFIAGFAFSDMIARLLGADDVVSGMTKTYLQVILLCSPMFIINSILSCFLRNDGATGLSMIAMLCASASNIVFDYLFIVRLQMGMFGAAVASGIAIAVGLIIISTFFIRKKNNFHLIKCAVSKKIANSIFSTGLPTFVSEVSAGAVIITFNMIILRLSGNTGVAAYGIIANISVVVLSIYNGIAGGVQPLISRYYGLGESINIRKVLRYALLMMFIFSAVFYVYAFFGASQIAGIFNSESNPVLQSIAIKGIRLYFTACIFAGFNIIISIYFTSTENVQPAHIISVLRGFLLIIPMAFLLSSIGGMTGVWLTFPVTELIVCLFAIYIFMKKAVKTRFH